MKVFGLAIFIGILSIIATSQNASANEKIINWRLNELPSITSTNFSLVDSPRGGTPDLIFDLEGDYDKFLKKISKDPNNLVTISSINKKVTLNEYHHGFDENTPLFVYSITKSFTAMMLIEEFCNRGFDSLDISLGQYGSRLVGTSYEKVYVRDALNMQSGHGKTFFKNTQVPMFMSFMKKEKNPLDWLKESSPDARPGTNFWYNANDTNSLGILLEDISGKKIHQNFSEKFTSKINLFGSIYWMEARNNENVGAYGLMGNARDLVQLSYVFMDKYLNNSCISSFYSSMWKKNVSSKKYAFQIWVPSSERYKKNIGKFSMNGYGGQRIVIDLKSQTVTLIYSITNKYRDGGLDNIIFGSNE